MADPQRNERRLDQERDTLLAALGVGREKAQQAERQNSWHVTCLYDRKDAALWRELQQHLDLLKCQSSTIISWHTHTMLWMSDPQVADPIRKDIHRASIVLLGLSIDFLSSLYGEARNVYAMLVQRAGEQSRPVSILPIRLRPVLWEDVNLHTCAMVPGNKAIGERKHRDSAYIEVVQAVQAVIEASKEKGAHS